MASEMSENKCWVDFLLNVVFLQLHVAGPKKVICYS